MGGERPPPKVRDVAAFTRCRNPTSRRADVVPTGDEDSVASANRATDVNDDARVASFAADVFDEGCFLLFYHLVPILPRARVGCDSSRRVSSSVVRRLDRLESREDILRGRVAPPRVCQNRPPVTLPIPVIPKLHRGRPVRLLHAVFPRPFRVQREHPIEQARERRGGGSVVRPAEGKRAKDNLRGDDGGGATSPRLVSSVRGAANPKFISRTSTSSASRSSVVLS